MLQDKASCFSAQALLGDVAVECGKGQGGQKQQQQPAVGDVIDACAAPGMCVGVYLGSSLRLVVDGPASLILFFIKCTGNKTSHAAALLHQIANAASTTPNSKHRQRQSKAKVFALDRDPKRLAILQRRVGDKEEGGMGYGSQLVVPLCEDFLALDPADPRMGKVSH